MNAFDLSAVLKLDTSQFDTSLAGASAGATSFISGLVKSFGVGQLAVAALGAAVGAFFVSSVKTGAEFDKAMSQVAATMGKSMSEMENDVGHATINANGKIIEFSGNLRDFAQVMGENTAFSATECAQALNYMALAGYDTQKSMDMLPNVLNLAAAGNMDLARASDMVTDTQTAFGLSTERTTQMVDEMAKAASTGNTSVEQLGDAFLVVGGLAQELNGGMVTLKDGTVKTVDGVQELEIALTAMANAGIKGSEAGTHMRNMLLKLSSPTADGTKQMEKLGVKVFDADGKMRSLKDVMGDLNTALGTLTQEEKIQAISDLFNTRDLASAEALLNAVGQDWDAIGESILDAQGAAQKMAATQLDNLAGDVTLFKSALEGTKIAISDVVVPALRGFVQIGTDLLTKITGFVKNHSEQIKSIFTGLANAIKTILDVVLSVISGVFTFIEEHGKLVEGVLVAVVSGFMAFKTIMFIQELIPIIAGIISAIEGIASAMAFAQAAMELTAVAGGGMFASLTAGFEAFAAAIETNPIGLLISAIVLLVAAIGYAIYETATWEDAVKSTEEAEKSLEEATKNLNSAYGQYTSAIDSVTKAQEDLAKAQEETGLSGEELFRQFDDGTRTYEEMNEQEKQVLNSYIKLREEQDKLTEATDKLKEKQQEKLKADLDMQLSNAKTKEDFDNIKKSVIEAFEKGQLTAEQAQSVIKGAMSEMSGQAATTFMEDIPNSLLSTGDAMQMGMDRGLRFRMIWNTISGGVDEDWTNAMDSVSTHSSGSFDEITSTWDVIDDWFDEQFTTAKNNIETAWQPVSQWFANVWNEISMAFNNAADWFGQKFSEAKTNIQNAWSTVVGWFQNIWNGIVNAFNNAGNWFGQKFDEAKRNIENAWNSVVGWFQGVWNGIVGVFNGVASWFGGVFSGAVGSIQSAFSGIGGFFAGVWNDIKSAFDISSALTWGRDLINNFTQGIRNGFDNLKTTLTRLAEMVRSMIGFSEPETGPLSNFHTFAPDMMQLFAQGIKDNKKMLSDTVEDAFDFKRIINTTEISGTLADKYSTSGGGGYHQTLNIYSPKALSPYEVARQSRNATKNMVLAMNGV